jgi:hypothetical protein
MPCQIIAVVDIIKAKWMCIATAPFNVIHEGPYEIAPYIGATSIHHLLQKNNNNNKRKI